MAQHVELPDIDALPEIAYGEARKLLQSGDLFFSSGDYWMSRLIRRYTKSPWSHVGVVLHIQEFDRVLLLESVEDMGVRFAPLSKYMKKGRKRSPYCGRMVVARCAEMTPEKIRDLLNAGMDELTQPYDRWEVLRIFLRIMRHKGRALWDNAYICSELVYACFAKIGIHFAYNPEGYISPEDIWKDDRIQPVCRLVPDKVE